MVYYDSVNGTINIAQAKTFTVDGHPAPYPEFIFTPSVPAPDALVSFTDLSVCYNNNGRYPCESWKWWFGDGNTSIVPGDVSHVYDIAKTSYEVDLEVCDEFICCYKEHLVPVKPSGGGGGGLPKWKEISPF